MKQIYIQREPLLNTMILAPKIGIKSIAIIGDGEPTCNPNLYDALTIGKENGLDLSISTNGVLLNTDEKILTILKSCVWMRFCISAGTKEGYMKIHQKDKFETVIKNIKRTVELRNQFNINCEIGMQAVFVPTLMLQEMIDESKLAIDLGVDYLVIKQCSLPDDGSTGMSVFDVNQYDSNEVQDTLELCESMSTDKTKIIPKWNLIALKGKKNYKHCASISLISEISGNGDWYPCGYMFGEKEIFQQYKFGNLHEQTIEEIYNSDRYWDIIKIMEDEYNVQKDCAGSCRQDKCNEFCYTYRNPPKGINFI